MVYITERGYILRDLNSENIQLDSNGNCKICNFRYCQYVGDNDGIYVEEVRNFLHNLIKRMASFPIEIFFGIKEVIRTFFENLII